MDVWLKYFLLACLIFRCSEETHLFLLWSDHLMFQWLKYPILTHLKDLFINLFTYLFAYMLMRFLNVYLYVFMYVYYFHALSSEVRIWCWMLWIWNYRYWWGIMWILGIGPQFSVGRSSALDQEEISIRHKFLCFY